MVRRLIFLGFCLFCFTSVWSVAELDSIPPVFYTQGDTLCADHVYEEAVRVERFEAVRTLQFQLRWDAQSIQMDTVWAAAPFRSGILINDQQLTQGRMNAVWFYPVLLQGLSLPDGDPLVHFRFSVAGDQTGRSLIDFDTTDPSFPFLVSQIINDSTYTFAGQGRGDSLWFTDPALTDQTILPTRGDVASGSIQIVIDGGLPPYQISWDNGQRGASITGLAAGDYYCTVADGTGCERSFGPFVVELITNVTNLEKNKVKVYPNPVLDRLSIESPDPIEQLVVFNISGQEVLKLRELNSQRFFELEITQLSSGVYWLEIQTSKGRSARERIIKN